jgi:hypothetical protein
MHCRHPRNHPRDEQGRDRTGGADQPRAHHRARAAGQGLDGDPAAVPVDTPRELACQETVMTRIGVGARSLCSCGLFIRLS